MFNLLQTRYSRRIKIAASLLLHAGVLFVAGRAFHDAGAVRVLLPGTSRGTRIDLTYNPGRAPVPSLRRDLSKAPSAAPQMLKPSQTTIVPPVDNAALAELAHPHLPLLQESAVNDTPSSPAPDANAGSDSFGSGDVQIALTTYSPSPRPNLSTLPRGTQGDVIVDVTIDPTGKVADLQILQTPGYGVEDTVMKTVKTWQFKPATRNGVAVASIQELLFHYGPVR